MNTNQDYKSIFETLRLNASKATTDQELVDYIIYKYGVKINLDDIKPIETNENTHS